MNVTADGRLWNAGALMVNPTDWRPIKEVPLVLGSLAIERIAPLSSVAYLLLAARAAPSEYAGRAAGANG